jgi:hypothetical protein
MTFTSILSIFATVFLVFVFVFTVPEITKRILDWIERMYNNTPKY